MTVLVTGIRGQIARLVADRLHADGADVRAASSATADIGPLPYPVLPVNLHDGDGLAGALPGVDRVLLYAGADGAESVARMLQDAGVEQVVLISSASVASGGPLADIAHHHRVAEDALRDRVPRWTFLRPGVFAGNTLAWADDVRAGRVALPYPDAYVDPIHERDVADAAVAALTSTTLDGQAPSMSGPESLTQRAQVETIAAALGTDVTVEAQDPDAWLAQAANWMPAGAARALLDLWASSTSPGPTEHTLRELTGGRPRTYADWVSDHRADFAA